MSEAIAASVVADEAIAGIAERLETLLDAADDGDDVTIGERLQASLATDGLSTPGARGLVDLPARIVARLRHRRMTDDFGEVDSAFELLGLHVPPGGRASINLHSSASGSRQVSVKAIGLGFGAGRKLTITIDEDIAERDTCMRVLQHAVARVRRYSNDTDEPMICTDVVAWDRREMVKWADCPYCGDKAQLSGLEFVEDAAHSLDLRAFDANVQQEITWSLDGSRRSDVGFAVPIGGGAQISAGYQIETTTTLTCAVTYTFPPGGYFVPYRGRRELMTMPYWARR
jgi:hypothetical protein